jgi:hypothetical protein
VVRSAQIDLLFDVYQAVSVISISRRDCHGSNAEEKRGVLLGVGSFRADGVGEGWCEGYWRRRRCWWDLQPVRLEAQVTQEAVLQLAR